MAERDVPPQVSLVGEILHRLHCRASTVDRGPLDQSFKSGVRHAAQVVVRCCLDRETGVMLARAIQVRDHARAILRAGGRPRSVADHRDALVQLIELASLLESVVVDHAKCHVASPD